MRVENTRDNHRMKLLNFASFLETRIKPHEVIQTSNMDCGPAALKSLLEGFGIPVSYGHLREACQTGLDGTSIDALEEAAVGLGLNAEQVMIPVDHLLMPRANNLPALVVKRLPNGNTHFLTVWRRVGDYVQVMDPAIGLHWLSAEQFLRDVYVHRLTVNAEDWREWAGSDDFTIPLTERMRQLRISQGKIQQWLERALVDAGWQSLATLDAAVRLVTALISAGGLKRGIEAERAVEQFLATGTPPDAIPGNYWLVQPDGHDLLLTGAVLIRVRGKMNSADTTQPELRAALEDDSIQLWREIFALLRMDGVLNLAILVGALALCGIGRIVEIWLLGSLVRLDLHPTLIGMTVAFVMLISLLDRVTHGDTLRVARHLELRLRQTFLEKLPRLGMRYFGSRLGSDMAERGHEIQYIHDLPLTLRQLILSSAQLVVLVIALILLYPSGAPITLAAGIGTVVLSYVSHKLITDHNMRVTTFTGILTQWALEALRGLVPIKAHGAERVIRRAAEEHLGRYRQNWLEMQATMLSVEGLRSTIIYTLMIVLILNYLREAGSTPNLLLFYWALSLPQLGEQFTEVFYSYSRFRSKYLRLLEPLSALEEESPLHVRQTAGHTGGVRIELEQVSVVATGHTLLSNITLSVEPGSHIAVVGASGAGKSTLISVLLGLHRPVEGSVCIDGEPLTGEKLAQLRRETAWVDPAIHLWNRSLLDNLHYGSEGETSMTMGEVINQANLISILETLPNGFQTPLGEGGGLVSGGEGQRVRLGRSMLRSGVRLVLLDEPFRGLDRIQREALMRKARQLWHEATLLCVTHDISETLHFDRVLVMQDGQIAEDGSPAELVQRDSLFAGMIAAEKAVKLGFESAANWRRLVLENGVLGETVR
jgi:ABC-type bacteriocin/lantibiotic exporter with double-glycine peptidase domain